MNPVSQLPEPRPRPVEKPIARETAAAAGTDGTDESRAARPTADRPAPPEPRRPSRRALRIPWLVRDAVSLYRRRILGILALNLAGVGGAWASLGGIYLYVRHLESGKPIAVHGYTL